MSMNPDWLTFRDMLKGYRKDAGLSQAKFGEAIGYSTPYICDLELGHRRPSTQFIEGLIKGMKMSTSEGKIWHLLGARSNGWKV